jgi:AcrR family transcriptional regulator
MVELAAERGYDAVTVRELARFAGISTRTFYQHYASKESCFLQAHDLIVRRLLKRLASVQVGVHDWRSRTRLAFRALLGELAGDLQAARVLFIEAYGAGPAALEQARWASRTLGSRIGEGFAPVPDGGLVSSLVVEGIVAGVASVVRTRLLTGRELELGDLDGPLLDWALPYGGEVAAERPPVACASTPQRSEERAVPPQGDLALLLAASAKLAAVDGASRLTVPQIAVAAGVPRRSFYAHFESADDCLAAALELQVDQALGRATDARASSSSWADGTRQGVLALCTEVAANTALAESCIDGPFKAGPSGIRCQQRLLTETASFLVDGAPVGCADGVTAEATAGAVLGVLRQAHAHLQKTPHISAAICYLALTPTVGADQAMNAFSKHTA